MAYTKGADVSLYAATGLATHALAETACNNYLTATLTDKTIYQVDIFYYSTLWGFSIIYNNV